jgi:hypothetical protein
MLKLLRGVALGLFSTAALAAPLHPSCTAVPAAPASRLDLGSELGWLRAQRAVLVKDTVNETVRTALAQRAIVLTLEAARLEAIADTASANRLRELLSGELKDTGWRIGFMANQGDRRARVAQAWLGRAGLFAATGPNVPTAREACVLLQSSELDGFAEARFARAGCISDSNPNAALGEIKAAAQLGHPGALDALGQICVKATPVDLACAVNAFCGAASAGRADSAARAAWLLLHHDGSTEALARAFKLYDVAAASGDANGQNGLGELFETGRGVARNDTSAATWYARAATQKLPVAQYNLARMYADGRGVPRDRKRALTLAQASAAAGFVRGREFEQWLKRNP